jgi:serine/threonine protein kinase
MPGRSGWRSSQWQRMLAPEVMAQSGVAVREGELLAGKYRVERVLGVGGMGIVVAARHEQLDQLVAIKFVRDEALGNAESVERFIREARAAAKLKSEHSAKVLDVGKLDSGAPYMVMEFLDGQDLGQVLLEQGPMTIELAAGLIQQACEAVAEAHAAGIVHRDLKPQNLFLTRTLDGSPKLKVLDFGVSKAIGLTSGGRAGLTRTSTMLGSPLYMAPEQMRSSRDVDGRVDIWALGVVLFELLTGRWPFEAETMPELCLKVVSEAPQPLGVLRTDVPPAIVAIVECCLQREPENRFASAHDLASALEPFVGRFSRRPRSNLRGTEFLANRGHPDGSPARTPVSPVQSSAPPARTPVPPGQSSAPRARASVPPRQSSPPPARVSTRPASESVSAPIGEGPGPTPLASGPWGSSPAGPLPSGWTRRRTAVWMGVVLVSGALIVLVPRLASHRGSSPGTPAPAASLTFDHAGSPVPSPPSPARPEGSTAGLAPGDILLAPMPDVGSAAQSGSSIVAGAPPPPRARPVVSTAPVVRAWQPAHVPSASRPGVQADDIPALR